MESEGGVLLPLFHEHPMMPWNDHMRKVIVVGDMNHRVRATIVKSVTFSSTRNVATTSSLNSSTTHLTPITVSSFDTNHVITIVIFVVGIS